MKSNPWHVISAETYERHMSAGNVRQLQTLNVIMEEQISKYLPTNLLILGVATGNGLEHTKNIPKVCAVDLNPDYLHICRNRYPFAKNIEFRKMDASSEKIGPSVFDLVIANLFLEYVDLEMLIRNLSPCLCSNGVISTAIQINDLVGEFVSESADTKHFAPLASIVRKRNGPELVSVLGGHGFSRIFEKTYPLPNQKKLCRFDFTRSPLA